MTDEEIELMLFFLCRVAPVGWQEQERLYGLVRTLEARKKRVA
jgi:hypothetical protein